MISEFVDLLEKSKAIHEKKNQDYAAQTNQFENFERSAELMLWFDSHHDKAFVSLIATKLARLATLLNSNQTPNNESVDDSFLDLFTYVGLWAAWHKRVNNMQMGYTPPMEQRISEELNKPTYKEGAALY